MPIADPFLIARGGTYAPYTLSYSGCGKKLGIYQKDGPGPLKRLYADRCTPALKKKLPPYRAGQRWDCPKCSRYLAFAALYRKERRKAWYLLVEAIDFKAGKTVVAKA